MVVTEEGIITDLSEVQPENDSSQMVVTEEGISIDSSEVHPENDLS